MTIGGTQAVFGDVRTPIAQATAPIVVTLELVGGIALINGVLVRPIAALLTRNILGALLLVRESGGIFVETGGVELLLVPVQQGTGLPRPPAPQQAPRS